MRASPDQRLPPSASTCIPRTPAKNGETEQRLYLLNAWRETPYYSDASAPLWPGRMSDPAADDGAPDARIQALEASFTPIEIANLTVLIGRDQHLETALPWA